MIEKIIPIAFKELLQRRIFTHDIESYDELSAAEVMHRIFDELSEENAHQFFEGSASHIHESSHRDVFYSTSITCNFLHLAIQLQRPDIVSRLLHEFHVNPRSSLRWTDSKDEESYDSPREGKESSSDSYSMTSLELAQKTGNAEIIELLSAVMNPSFTIKAKAMVPSSSSAEQVFSGEEAGYEAETEVEKALVPKPVYYKKRLILGDGNLSYSRALLKKRVDSGQTGFSEALTVTEYNAEDSLREFYLASETGTAFRNFEKNVNFLREMGAEVAFGVDATTLENEFHDRRFRRIHFNFPYYHDSSLTAAANKDKTRELVGKFFESAAKIQQPGDRIHMGLVTGFSDPVWYENATYGVAEFCEAQGYVYIAKRNFIDPAKGLRYPGYFHVKTSGGQTVNTAEKGREFIFEKKIPGKQYEHSSQKKKTSRSVEYNVLKARDTDSDTSSYVEHSESDSGHAKFFPTTQPPLSAEKVKKSASVQVSKAVAGGGSVSVSVGRMIFSQVETATALVPSNVSADKLGMKKSNGSI